jgi:hypothetical protein
MAFTDDKYEAEGYSLSVGKLLDFFGAKFPFDEQEGCMAAARRFLFSYPHGRFILSLSCG